MRTRFYFGIANLRIKLYNLYINGNLREIDLMNRAINSYDYLRVVTAFFVVLLHASASYVVLYNELSTLEWMAGNVYNSLSRWTVPVFFMLSGAFLLDPKRVETLAYFYKKRVLKIVVPLLAWSMIYYVYKGLTLEMPMSLKDFVSRFIANDIYYHLWFLYVLLGIYLLVPLLRHFMKDVPPSYLLYFAVIWFIAVPFMKTANEFYGSTIYFDIPIAGYLGYFILGYYLRVVVVKKSVLWGFFVVGTLSLAVTIYGTFTFTKANDSVFYDFFYSNYSPTTALIAIAMFLLVKQLKNTMGAKLVQLIGGTTFGIYLVHALLLNYFVTNWLDFSELSNWLSIPLTAFIIFVVSFIVSYIIGNIPILNKIMP